MAFPTYLIPMNRRLFVSALTLGSAAFVFNGCKKETAAPSGGSASASVIKLAVIPKGTTHVFWKTVEAGAKKAAADLKVEILWKSGQKEDDRADQIKIIDNMRITGVQGIAVAPTDAEALRKPCEAATKAGIPVLIFDSPLAQAEGAAFSYVGTNNRSAGRLAGEQLAKILGGKGRVMMLRYQQGSASTQEREDGFLEEIKKSPGIVLASVEQYGGATDAESLSAAKNLLLRFSGENAVDGIYCPNQSTTYGMLQALRQNGLAGRVKFVGFDPSAPLLEALDKGEINGLVSQNPFKMGYLSVETLVKKLKGETVSSSVDTGTAFVTKDNVQSAEVQAVISPKL